MSFMYGITDILWGALRAIDASTDARKESGPVLKLKREILRTIAQLETGEPERPAAIVFVREPDNVA